MAPANCANEQLIHPFLSRPGNLAFSTNRQLLSDGEQGFRVTRLPSGHLIAYGPHGRRVLATDPEGHPLHECEWTAVSNGPIRMTYARVKLDWGQWVGIKPLALVTRTVLDLSRRPGWERLTADDLRDMAARSLKLPLEEVKFFYTDEHLVIHPRGRATIEHVKDALYVLDRGCFESGRADIDRKSV